MMLKPTLICPTGIFSRLWREKELNVVLFFLLLGISQVVSADYEVVDIPKTGIIQGVVTFPGETPPLGLYANPDAPECPSAQPQGHLLVTQRNRGLQNAVVFLNIEQGKPLPSPKRSALSFLKCAAVPRVQTGVTGTSLALSTDGVTHHVRGFLGKVQIFQIELAPGTVVRRPLVAPGLYRVTCDDHFWEIAYIYLFDHPYSAVTDADGMFTLKQVPKGTYTIGAWHEGWEKRGHTPAGRWELQPVGDVSDVTVRHDQTSDVRLDEMKPTF